MKLTMLSFLLDPEIKGTLDSVLFVCAVFTGIVTSVTLAWRRIIKPTRIKTKAAFAEAVAGVTATALDAKLSPVADKVDDLHRRLSKHLTDEGEEIAGINERFGRIEDNHKCLIQRLDDLGDQLATDSAKVVNAINSPSTEEDKT